MIIGWDFENQAYRGAYQEAELFLDRILAGLRTLRSRYFILRVFAYGDTKFIDPNVFTKLKKLNIEIIHIPPRETETKSSKKNKNKKKWWETSSLSTCPSKIKSFPLQGMSHIFPPIPSKSNVFFHMSLTCSEISYLLPRSTHSNLLKYFAL